MRRRVSALRDRLSDWIQTARRCGWDRLVLLGIRYLSWSVRLHDKVSGLPSSVSTAVFRLSRRAVRSSLRGLRRLRPRRYTDADPYEVIHVDPACIDRTTEECFSKRRGWVVKGTWDERGEPFMERRYPKAIEQRFVEGMDWADTVLSERYEGVDLEERGDALDRLYRRLRDHGYKSQRELLQEDPEVAWSGLNDAMHPLANEIAVDIGRDGAFLWNMCGQHRLAMAKVLGIDTIPVQVFRRHADWQAIREQVRKTGSVPDGFEAHPDLRNLLSDESLAAEAGRS